MNIVQMAQYFLRANTWINGSDRAYYRLDVIDTNVIEDGVTYLDEHIKWDDESGDIPIKIIPDECELHFVIVYLYSGLFHPNHRRRMLIQHPLTLWRDILFMYDGGNRLITSRTGHA